MDSVQRARRGLTVFLVMLVAASVPLEYAIAKKGLEPELVLLLTFSPASASIVARLVMAEGFKDVSFKLDRRMLRSFFFAVVYPLFVGLPAYSLAWSLGLARFEPPTMHPYGFPIEGDSSIERALFVAAIAIVVGILAMIPIAIGEELGWRGFMLTRLMQARVPQPVLVSAVIWAVWHVPLLASGHYIPTSKPLVSILLFFVSLSSVAWIMAKLRLTTGSIWPAVVMHAAWNSIIGNIFTICTQGEDAALWASEAGVFVAVFAVLTAVLIYPALFYKRRRKVEIPPSEIDELPMS